MAAIISDKFRIFNAKQFLESLSEGSTDNGAERTRMYFFVGRPQRWDTYVEIYNKSATAFVVGNEVYVGASYASATFKGTIREVYEDSLLLFNIGPSTSSVPSPGSTLKGWNGTADTGATAVTGVYRYASEDVPPVPLDNQKEKFDLYDDIIAAKRITSDFARAVVRRYNWDLVANPKFDMWKPDYSATPGSGGQVGKQAATGATTIGEAKFYVVNSLYEVFKCVYNGENPANPTGQNATNEPKTAPSAGQGSYANGIFTEEAGTAGYVWKYLFTIPTNDVLRFLSTDFLPIVAPTDPTRQATEAAAVEGAVHVALIENAGANLPNGTHYAPIIGDGSGGVVQLVVSAGALTSATVTNPGSGYAYASVPLATGTGSGSTAYGLFSDSGLTASVAVGGTATGALEAIISPQGGHGSDMELELNAKRIMTNIRLTYAEGSGDFPVDNDFRRIGILKDPYAFGTTSFATVDTVNGLYAVKVTGVTSDFQSDETISQTVSGGTAYGTVVSWTLDSNSTTDGVLKYIQSPDLHKDSGVVRAFESNGANAITGAISLTSANVDVTDNSSVLGVTFANGLATPEIAPNSGDMIYVENRRLITRAPDQIEDIKLVIEF
jgi:hypothetical protein